MIEASHATGSCLCGAVRFTANGPPYRVGLCHCLDCRRHGGAPFAAFAIFPADRVVFTGQEPGVFQSSAQDRRRFCRTCGSTVSSDVEGSDEIELHLGTFDEVGRFAPTYELWVCRREPWLPELPSIRHRYDRNRTGSQRRED